MPATQLRLGPADHGRELTLDEFEAADFDEGHKYELIDGSLEVSPAPNAPEDYLTVWLAQRVGQYSLARPDVINYVTTRGRAFVHARPRATCPEPDLAAFRNYPRGRGVRDLRWRDHSPVLVAEVLVEGDPRKDLERNPPLYLAVPSIAEYWVLDGRADPDEPTLIAHRRDGAAWEVVAVPFGGTYTTPLLPDFVLVIDPHA